eukprot:9427325-Heterocapsa_arctica.AAC.1
MPNPCEVKRYEGSGGFHCTSSMKYIPEILANLWIAFLSVAYMGQGADNICRFEPSAAQRR